MRRPGVVLAALVVLGAIWVGFRLLTVGSDVAFTLGVPDSAPAAELQRGAVACQLPIALPDDDAAFDAVALSLGTYFRPGPAVEVTVRPLTQGPPIARGRLEAGYGDVAETPRHVIPVGHVASREPLRVCVRNLGPGRVAIFGSGALASRTSSAFLDGASLPADLNLAFMRREERSIASLMPAMFERAALFRADWVGAWTYVLAALVVLVAVPGLLVAALRSAERP